MTDIDQKLEILYDLLVDNLGEFETALIDLIQNPEKINDINNFGLLLSCLKNTIFINPLLLKISTADKDDFWLRSFLYAVINLINETPEDEEFDTPRALINKLENWTLNNTGELAWKAAKLLAFYESETAQRIQLAKLEQKDFWMTHAECIQGLLRFNKEKYTPLVMEIVKDETRDKNLREHCEGVLQRLQKPNR